MTKINALNELQRDGILLIDKPKNKSSFYLVKILRPICKIKKIGHTGTLDPIASGLMILLIGKKYTTKASKFLGAEKTYIVQIELGKSTDTYDSEGNITNTSQIKPTQEHIIDCIKRFQGIQSQIPPMFSAKKVAGKKLYELARQNIEVQREPIHVTLDIKLINYSYPLLEIRVQCSSGTYIRSLAHDMGVELKSFGYVKELRRIQNGPYSINDALNINTITDPNFQFENHLLTLYGEPSNRLE